MESKSKETENDSTITSPPASTPPPPPPRLSLNARAFSIDALLSPTTPVTAEKRLSSALYGRGIDRMDESDSSQVSADIPTYHENLRMNWSFYLDLITN